MQEMEDSNFQETPPDTPIEETETPRSSKKNYLLYGIALLWSFFLVFIFMYFLVYRSQKTEMQKNLANSQALQDSVATDSVAINDSTQTAQMDSAVQKAEPDTVKKGKALSPSEGFLTVEDEMQILQLENGRRKREIDYLWNEMRNLKKQTLEIAEKATQVDTTPIIVTKPVVKQDTTPSFAVLRQKQLEKDQQEKERQAAKAAEQQRQEQIIATNAKLYSSMTPKQAATILNEFDNEMVASMLKKLRERQAAKILKEMNQAKAIEICKLLAK
ncbi:MAG TPA: hypothetical protein PLP19_06765 [bacterium]|nr:hypothetical protein [bacterium]HPN43172.1 hypothetical protein [bacterium]